MISCPCCSQMRRWRAVAVFALLLAAIQTAVYIAKKWGWL